MTDKKNETPATTETIKVAAGNQSMSLEAQVAAVTAKVDMFIGEMRDRDNQRAAEIREIRNSIDDMGKHVRNIAIAAIAGVGAIAAAVIGFIYAMTPRIAGG